MVSESGILEAPHVELLRGAGTGALLSDDESDLFEGNAELTEDL